MPWLSSPTYTDLLAKASRADALAEELARTRDDLRDCRAEVRALQDRFLEKLHVRPVSEPLPAPRQAAPSFPVISPFQAIDEETERAARDAWIDDLAEGYMEEKGIDRNTARQIAQAEYVRRYEPIIG